MKMFGTWQLVLGNFLENYKCRNNLDSTYCDDGSFTQLVALLLTQTTARCYYWRFGYWRKCWWSSCWNRARDLSQCRWWIFVARYGFEKSEHISKVMPFHPNDSNTIWVASQGPLWSSGGERGLYKSTDGGKNWLNKLSINKWTGVTDLVIDPTNPDILYLASWQRHRNVAAHMGGGPGTSIYKSVDGGETWVEIDNGLPSSNMGKIGLAISL